MKKRDQVPRGSEDSCFTIDELYRYVAHPPQEEGAPEREGHLSNCPRCQEELAEILKLLHPEPQAPSDALLPLSEAEIAQTAALIRDVGHKEERQKDRLRWWIRWAAAAAVVIALLGAGAGGYRYYDITRSNQYFAQAKASLEQVYAAKSPNGLRLDLPFRSAATSRAAAADSFLRQAENLFFQALASREDMPAAHLGLAAIYLSESQFAKARDEFQKVLNIRRNYFQALLGRGVAEYEEAQQAEDPVKRSDLLGGALTDFDNAIQQQPGSADARYNRIWVLYETGRHEEALAEIDDYLSRDPDSIWAAKLRDLQTKIRLLRLGAANEQLERAARSRDLAALASLARLVPEKVPAAIRFALKMSLRREGNQAAPGVSAATDLRWAAETTESYYSAATGDHSWKALLTFYAGLSAPQRRTKEALDKRLDNLATLLNGKQPDAALHGSESLGRDFSLLGDNWQLCNIHLLRGNCFYWQADFDRAEFEYREMLRVAEQTGAPELRAKALAALSVAYATQSRPDDQRSCLTALRTIAERCGYDSYKASAALSSGWLHLRLNHLEESLKDYTAALSYAYRNRDEIRLEEVLADLFPLMKRLGRPEDGRSLYSEAVERMAALKKVAGPAARIVLDSCQLNLLYKQGEIALQAGDLDQAESSLKMVLEGPLGRMSELECRTRLGLVQVCLGKKRFSDAKLLLDESLTSAVSGKYEELEWQARFFEGKLQKVMGDTAAALAAFNRSVDILESMRRKITSEDIRQQFLTRRFDPYKEIVSLLCHDMHDGQKGLEFVSRAKSMTLREYLEIPTGNQARQTEEIAQTLRALSVDYFFTADGLLAFVSSSKGNQVVELRSSGPELEQEVKEYLNSIRTGDEASFNALSRRLYGELLEPVLRMAGNEKYERLLIFPDGPLHLLPFGGLEDAQGRFLLERYALSYAPSRSVLRHCLSLGRGSAASGSRTVLLLDGTGNLPGAGDELARLSKLYGNGPRILTAREPDVAGRLAADAEILHFAGHATVVNGKPALMLAPAPHQVVLDSRDISSWRLRKNRLVTLAGCETGIGPQAEGEIPWGLVPAFLNAGAPALIVSLLPLDDTATANLTSRFYGLLAGDSISKASALQQAQLSLLASARASGRLNPAAWLPYVLIGDPR